MPEHPAYVPAAESGTCNDIPRFCHGPAGKSEGPGANYRDYHPDIFYDLRFSLKTSRFSAGLGKTGGISSGNKGVVQKAISDGKM
jgi:hypothetical protein